MRIGMVGLGRMGGNMTKRLVEAGHQVVGHARRRETVDAASADGALGAYTLEELVRALEPPRVVWVMVPAGSATTEVVDSLSPLLHAGDTIVDGGNSHHSHAQAASSRLRERGLAFVDVGVSGGVWGLKNGYCLMVGGDEEPVARLEPVFVALAPPGGWAHVGPSGAGHYVKMVHNGIEYGMLQAYAEGFSLLDAASELHLDLHQVAALWNRGSVVRSWLLDLAELALQDRPGFAQVRGYVEDSGEGRWTIEEAVERGVAAPVIAASLFARFSSRQPDSFAARIVAALRNQFGGHRLFSEAATAEAVRAATTSEQVAQAGPEGAASDRPGGHG